MSLSLSLFKDCPSGIIWRHKTVQETVQENKTLIPLSTCWSIENKVLKPGLDHMVRSGKPWTIQIYGRFRVKNRSMQKKAWNRGLTARFCEPWPVHTVPMFQALNGTVGLSFQIFFFLYGVVWAYGHARSTHRNPETLKSQSLSHLSSLPLHRPPLYAHSVTLSITLYLSLTLPHHRCSRSHSLPFFNFNSFRLYSCKVLYPF